MTLQQLVEECMANGWSIRIRPVEYGRVMITIRRKVGGEQQEFGSMGIPEDGGMTALDNAVWYANISLNRYRWRNA